MAQSGKNGLAKPALFPDLRPKLHQALILSREERVGRDEARETNKNAPLSHPLSSDGGEENPGA